MVMRNALLALGILLVFVEQFVQTISLQAQFVLFILGVAAVGIPHGAADLLVASKNASGKKVFSKRSFHLNYMGKLVFFALLFWLFPVAANLIFVICAAFHFGETDLAHFAKINLAKEIFVIFYGLLIVTVIILPHFDTLKPMFNLFKSGHENEILIATIDQKRFAILCGIAMITFISFLFYVSTNPAPAGQYVNFLASYAALLFVLYKLPMILGFTFYFVAWHSIFSLKNIFHYLRKDGLISIKSIVKQISFYSLISFFGFLVFSLTGLIFLNNHSFIAYVFLALAVLTAPHMLVMHNMYKSAKFLPIIEKYS